MKEDREVCHECRGEKETGIHSRVGSAEPDAAPVLLTNLHLVSLASSGSIGNQFSLELGEAAQDVDH